jgi:hypothetical protein
MKISSETIALLKTFSSINTNLVLRKGSTLSTISGLKNVYASADVPEDFPVDYAIYDLPEFLSVLSLFKDADVTFDEKVAVIKEGKSAIRYYAADISLLVLPEKPMTFVDPLVEFILPQATLTTALKTAGALRSADIAFEGDGENIYVVVADLKNPNANSFRVVVGETDKTFRANLKVENLKMSPGEYKVGLTKRKIKFENTSQKVTFYTALETTSSFSE